VRSVADTLPLGVEFSGVSQEAPFSWLEPEYFGIGIISIDHPNGILRDEVELTGVALNVARGHLGNIPNLVQLL